MNFPSLPAQTIATALVFFGCERITVVVEILPATPIAEPIAKTKTPETLRLGSAVDDFEREPSENNYTSVKRALAGLDEGDCRSGGGGCQEERKRTSRSGVKQKNLQAYRTAEGARFTAAQAKAPLSAPPSADARTGAGKSEDTANRVGNTIADAAQKTAT